MVYSGNESLSPEIRKRIGETFRQTLHLAAKDSRQEALLGCDFILRLDPHFEPARILSERLEASGTVELDDLLEEFEESFGRVAPPEAESADSVQVDLVEESPAAAEPTPTDVAEPSSLQTEDPPDLLVDAIFGQQGEETEPEAPPAVADRQPTIELKPAPLPASEPVAPATPPPPAPAAPEPPAPAATEPPPPASPQPPAPAVSETTTEPDPSIDEPSLDFAGEPSVALDSDSQSRIDELLAEGQAAFDRVEYQAAIDAWSRIFLIDIDHPEANRRIELARKLKAELERGVEEAVHEGVSALEGGDFDAARAAFKNVLEVQPNHVTARDYLDRLESDEPHFPTPEEAFEEEEEPAAKPAASPVEPAAATEAAPEPRPMPGPRPRPARTVAARRPGPSSRGKLFIYIGAAVLGLVLIGGWFVASNWSRIFPNASEPVTGVEKPDPIVRAKELFEQGQQSIAIAQLRRLGPDDPAYPEAQALIFQWESGLARPSPGEDPEAQRLEQRQQLIAEARVLETAGETIPAESLLGQANAIARLEGADLALYEEIRERLDPVRAQLEIYQQGEWGVALRDLWRMHESDPSNPIITRLMVDSYYNLGVRDLQRGDTAAAEKQFSEARQLDADDQELARLRRFAALYRDRPPDLRYRIFVKYLPFR